MAKYYSHRLLEVRVRFNGIYEWGGGWVSTDCRTKWKQFLEQYKGNSWKVLMAQDSYSSDYLVSTGSSVYFHPMSFDTYIKLIGRSSHYVNGIEFELFSQAEELLKLSKDIAEHCGGSISVEFIKLHEFNDNTMCKTTDVTERVIKDTFGENGVGA